MEEGIVRYHNFTPAEIRELYQLVLERMEISSPQERSAWAQKVRAWSSKSRNGAFTASLAELANL